MIPIEPERYVDGRPLLLAGLRRRHPLAEMAQRIPQQWRDFHALGAIPGSIGGTLYGAVCGAVGDSLEYMCAVEVRDFDALPPDIGCMRVPAQHYAVFLHRGSISTIGGTWERIWKEWLPRSGRRTADTPDFEVYDARYDAQSGYGDVEIWFPLVREI